MLGVPAEGEVIATDSLRRQWMEVSVVLCLTVVPSLILGMWSFLNYSATTMQPSASYRVISQITPAIRTIPVVAYIIWNSREGPAHFGIKFPKVIDIAWALLTWGVATASVRLLASGLPHERPTPTLIAMHESYWLYPDWLIPIGVITTVAAAFSEEIALRAFLLVRLKGLWNSTAAAIIVSSLLFASYHIYEGPQAVLYVFAHGLIYAGAFLVTRSITVPTLAHAAWNLAIFATQLGHRMPSSQLRPFH